MNILVIGSGSGYNIGTSYLLCYVVKTSHSLPRWISSNVVCCFSEMEVAERQFNYVISA
jgi:hypothetical protein